MKPLFSDAWYRVASLRPSLRAQVRVHRHTYRGQRWHVVQDLTSGQFLRFDPVAYRAMALMDGMRTVDEVWKLLVSEFGDDSPSQDALMRLLTQLYRANLLITGEKVDVAELVERGSRTRWARIKAMFQNPMSIRVPLFSPDRAVGALVSPLGPVFWRLLLLGWLVLLGAGLLLVGRHWDALTSDISAQVFTPDKILGLVLIFPVLKAIHEFGHCIAIKALGGTVHEVGVMFLIFVPIPYVEASQSYTFASKWHRMLVGASGMMIELAVAAVAVMLWVDASEGLFKSVMHQVLILASVTTVFFNANPLLRFDGYYILSDWLEIPNLAARANALVQSWVRRRLFGVEEAPTQDTRGESAWMVPYAFGSFAYKCFITFSIVLLVAEQYLAVGLVLAAWSLWGFAVKPLGKYLQFLAMGPSLEGRRLRASSVTFVVVGTVVGLLAGVPVTSATNAEAVVWVPEQSRVRVPVSCFGDRLLARPGEHVSVGQPLFSCVDPVYQAELAFERARLEEIQFKQALARTVDRVQWNILQNHLKHQQERLALAQERARETVVLSPHAGRFVLRSPAVFEGQHLPRGEVVAHVIEQQRLTLLALVEQRDIDLVRQDTSGVRVRLTDRIFDELRANIAREVPSAARELPSLAFAIPGGGAIGLDPRQNEPGKPPVALDHYFQFELQPVDALLPERLGGRAFIRFEHSPEPLAQQWYRQVRQMFIRRFSV
jgi:putative peptide zinc metalloprotease protein